MKKTSKLKLSPKKLIFVFTLVLLIAGSIVGTYFLMQYKNNGTVLGKAADPKEENTKLIAQVGKLIKLPAETPSVATVSDITKLKDQTLFKDAENGDKVLIFNQAKRAIVYRPNTNQIIEVGNVVVAPEVSSAPTTEKVTIALLNGTKTAGYAKKVGADLVGKFTTLELKGTGNANSEYSKNTVYVIKSNKSTDEMAQNIANSLNGEVVTKLPDNEEKPNDADILIILGE